MCDDTVLYISDTRQTLKWYRVVRRILGYHDTESLCQASGVYFLHVLNIRQVAIVADTADCGL